MRFTVDFEIPLVVVVVVVIRIIKVKYIFTICISDIILYYDETLLILSHFTSLTRNEAFYFYIFMSFNQPRQLYSTNNPYDTLGMRENVECMIMVYNNENDDDEKCKGDGWMEIKRSIAYIQLYSSTKMNFIFDASFFTMRHRHKSAWNWRLFMCGMVNMPKYLSLLCVHTQYIWGLSNAQIYFMIRMNKGLLAGDCKGMKYFHIFICYLSSHTRSKTLEV